MYINGILFNNSLEEILDELVKQLRLNDIQYLQKMKPSGGDIQVCCPYHSFGLERKPSMGIRKSDGVCHCFTCGETHSLQELVSYCFGYENDMIGAFGWKWLVKNFATVSVEEREDVKLDLERNQDYRKYRRVGVGGNSSNDVNNATDNDAEINSKYITEQELDGYRYIHNYMYERKMTDEVIEMYDIGYDATSKAITFPCKDISGNCLFIARRSVKTKWFNIPKDVQKPLYGLYECSQCKPFPDEIIVCEGMIDAITVHVFNPNKWGVALFGLGNALQFEQLRKLPCRKLILATDADDAGMKAREKIRKNVTNKIITEYIWDKSMAKDLNDMTKEQFLSLEEVL